MPKQSELTQAGYRSLAVAIDRHGGIFAVARRLGLQLSHAQHPDGYWDDFANIERELFAYIEKHGTPGVMPSRAELIKAGRNTLVTAMTQKHGGLARVAQRLGLRLSSMAKPGGYWDNSVHIELAILEFNETRGTLGVMPTRSELQKAGRADLASAITNHGGFLALAEQFGLRYTNTAKPAQYWDDFTNVERELLDLITKQGTPGVMPTYAESPNRSG